MQPMMSGGKLFEPQLLPNKDQEEVLQPTYERTKDGPRINVIQDSDSGDSVVIPTNVKTTSRRSNRTLRMDDLASGDSSSQISRTPSGGGRGVDRRKKLSSGNLETDEDGADVSLLIIISILNFS